MNHPTAMSFPRQDTDSPTRTSAACSAEEESPAEGGAAVAEPEAPPKKQAKRKAKSKPKKNPPGMMPPWRVLLHNDNRNTFHDVIVSVTMLTPLKEQEAVKAALEAHTRGLSLLLVTHKERAELYVEQFKSRRLTVTIEPAV